MSSSLTGRPIGLSCMVVVGSGRMRIVLGSTKLRQAQTCDGISNRLLYSRESSASASASWNDSRRGVEGELLAGAVGDVAQVAEPGAQVADLDVGVGLSAGS